MPIPRSELRLDEADLQELLSTERTMRVGTAGPEASPHVVPMWFVWHGGAIWINNLRKARRSSDLSAGSSVALCIDTGFEYFELRGAVLYGRPVAVEPDDPDLAEVRRAFGAKYFYGADISEGKSHQWLKVVPERIVSWDFRKIPAGRDGREVLSRKESPAGVESPVESG
jgi:nitroimidazol reductase NimA-like FMN-containing flavoprotein (pyridoxamine 5'-phosphate oxidase superfamily)